MTKTIGLLVMAYGTPYQESDIEAYYTDIRHGKKPTEAELQDLKDRYKHIGGLSPLANTTNRQAETLCDALNEAYSDVEFKLYIGLKHIHPFIEDAVKSMHEEVIEEAESSQVEIIEETPVQETTPTEELSPSGEPTTELYDGKPTENYYWFGDEYRQGIWFQDESGSWKYR